MSRGTLGLRDPDVDRYQREREARRRVWRARPLDRALTCSCGCATVHEVARRTTYDDCRLVVRSDGEVRLWPHRSISPDVFHVDRLSGAFLRFLGSVCILTAAEAGARLLDLHGRAA